MINLVGKLYLLNSKLQEIESASKKGNISDEDYCTQYDIIVDQLYIIAKQLEYNGEVSNAVIESANIEHPQ